jgi:uncharacterized membrane protein YjfL (UPF0719 family)
LPSDAGNVLCDQRRNKLELSESEDVIFFAAVLVGLILWIRWYCGILSIRSFHVSRQHKSLLMTVPAVCLALSIVCLKTLAAGAVRSETAYIALYAAIGAGWLGAMTNVFPFLGISARDDVLERGNSAASWTVAGAVLGACCAFTGANIGEGPGFEVVIFSAVLSSLLFIAIWFAVERLTAVSESITIDRNVGAGIRLGGLLIAIGLLSGWSVAGTWVSVTATLRDFAIAACPAIVLGSVAVLVERVGFAHKSRSAIGAHISSIVAGLYVTVAIGWIIIQGVDP